MEEDSVSLSDELSIQRVHVIPDPIESYENRKGYDPLFIDGKTRIELPILSEALKQDAATFIWKGVETHELTYTHFSTAVSKSRRMPIFSACNIDGETAKTITRTDIWKFDPRIPSAYQILEDSYGNQKHGLFSRGHLTRRQDADWGDQEMATLADADTFHVTNAAPQVQHFNSGLWGSIENYILSHAKKDNMRLCVLTGPVFQDDDPIIKGIQIPLQFWKVVVFLHDKTGEITASGYLGSQRVDVDDLKPLFVFGDFRDLQRPLAEIEQLARLSFGELTARDVSKSADVELAPSMGDVLDILMPLRSFGMNE